MTCIQSWQNCIQMCSCRTHEVSQAHALTDTWKHCRKSDEYTKLHCSSTFHTRLVCVYIWYTHGMLPNRQDGLCCVWFVRSSIRAGYNTFLRASSVCCLQQRRCRQGHFAEYHLKVPHNKHTAPGKPPSTCTSPEICCNQIQVHPASGKTTRWPLREGQSHLFQQHH